MYRFMLNSSVAEPARAEEPAARLDHDRRLTGASSRSAFAVALVVFATVFVANCWVGDDAYISFRVSDNLIHGYGPRWNVAERVQAFTNPLWTFLMAGAGLISGGEFFYTSMLVSFAFGVATLAIAWRRLHRDADRWLLLALLLSSKAFVDYTSSGLEYPVSYLLLTLFAARLLRSESIDPGRERDELPLLVLLASLAFVNRADTLLLYLPSLAWVLARQIRGIRGRDVARLALATTPAVAWLVFALVYYGFPFPNTYYAKVAIGVPHWVQLRQGLAYVASSVRFDPITLATVAAAAVTILTAGEARARTLVLGACAYVFYTIWVGGDFMAGRFLALPFLASALLLARLPKTREAALAGVALLVVLNVVDPIAPIKTIPSSDIGWPWRLQNGVKDERGAYYNGVNPLQFETFRRMPDNLMAREGRSVHASPEKVIVHPWIGMVGFEAGPEKYIIDPNALSDPLLARLPVGPEFYFEFWVSHFTRSLPTGYVESRREGRNLIQDPAIHAYFDKILNVTTGPIFSGSRLRDIVQLNWGRLRHFGETVKAAQRLDATIRVSNPLFWTHAGALDARQEAIASSGRAGYLLIGPGVPLRPGTYRIRWTGTAAPRQDGDVGFVEVCYNDCRNLLARSVISPGTDTTIADVRAGAGPDVRDIEFRMYVNEGSQVTVRNVAITQQ